MSPERQSEVDPVQWQRQQMSLVHLFLLDGHRDGCCEEPGSWAPPWYDSLRENMTAAALHSVLWQGPKCRSYGLHQPHSCSKWCILWSPIVNSASALGNKRSKQGWTLELNPLKLDRCWISSDFELSDVVRKHIRLWLVRAVESRVLHLWGLLSTGMLVNSPAPRILTHSSQVNMICDATVGASHYDKYLW